MRRRIPPTFWLALPLVATTIWQLIQPLLKTLRSGGGSGFAILVAPVVLIPVLLLGMLLIALFQDRRTALILTMILAPFSYPIILGAEAWLLRPILNQALLTSLELIIALIAVAVIEVIAYRDYRTLGGQIHSEHE
jgi:hypothetical protein